MQRKTATVRQLWCVPRSTHENMASNLVLCTARALELPYLALVPWCSKHFDCAVDIAGTGKRQLWQSAKNNANKTSKGAAYEVNYNYTVIRRFAVNYRNFPGKVHPWFEHCLNLTGDYPSWFMRRFYFLSSSNVRLAVTPNSLQLIYFHRERDLNKPFPA